MLTCQKHRFSLPEQAHYLNCAYMSPSARNVEAAGVEGVRRKSDPSQLGVEDFFAESHAVRALFARLIHAEAPERVAILPAASYGIATVARNLTLERGQNIVLLHEQFPSNVYTWRRLAESAGADLRYVAPPVDGAEREQRWNTRILEAIDAQTAVIALPHVHWTDGTLFDLTAIGVRAREVGAWFVVDGTQSVGALPFDVRSIRPDALICGGYKWLMGPYSLSLGYFGPRMDDGVPLEENWINRKDSEQFSGLVNYQPLYQPGAIRYDVGERSNFALMPMMQAALTNVLDWTPEAIQAYCAALLDPLLSELASLGLHVAPSNVRGSHLFGIRFGGEVDLERVRLALQERHVHVSVRGSAIRVSPHLYNDAADLAALVDALRSAQA